MNKFLFIVLMLLPSYIMKAQIVFTPQWTPQAQFAGYYAAYDKGFYDEAGVKVDIQHPSVSYSAFNLLWEGSSDIITLQLVQAMIEIDRGMSLINILQTSQQNGLMLVSRSDSLRTLDDFKGKKIGVWKVGSGELAYMMDVENEMNIKWVPFLQGMNLYISGAIDATLAMSYSEYLQIKVSGHEDKPYIRLSDTKYDFPEDGVYVTADFYQKNKEKVNAFVEASRKGWDWVRNNRDEALDIVMKYVKESNVPTNRYNQKWMLDAILEAHEDVKDGTPSYTLDEEAFNRLNEALVKYGYIARPVVYERFTGGTR